MSERISALTEILPYVREFQGSTFIVKIGGEVCAPSSLPNIAEQLSLIHHIGIKVVLVHGGGPQIDQLLQKLGIERQVIGGRRITNAETLDAAKMIYNGAISADIVSALAVHGTSAVGLSGADAGLIYATRRPVQQIKTDAGDSISVDFGHVGDIKRIDPKIIELLFSQRIMPVICSLGLTESGELLNINADTIASSVAQTLGASKLIVMSNVPGVLARKEDPSSLISYTDIEQLQTMIKGGAIRDGMLPKVQACIEAVRGGVSRTHIIDGTRPKSLLLELFLNEGCGTMIVDEKERASYETNKGYR